jgi:hypothetical protein
LKVLTTNTIIPPRIVSKGSTPEGVLPYDTDNAYPQRMMVFIDSSGQATRCVKLLERFYIGGGFREKTFWKAKLNNRGLTGDRLLRKIAHDKALFSKPAIHVNWNANFKISSINVIPFEHCRLSKQDDLSYSGKVLVYDDWARWKSSRIEKKFIDSIDVFNPNPDVIQDQVDAAGGWDKYKGQILYPDEYVKSPFDSVIEDIDSDAQCKVFKNKNIRNNFTATHIGKYKGRFETEPERRDFANNLKAHQGADNASNIILIELDGQEDSFELVPLTMVVNEKGYQYTEESVRDNIRRVILAPQVLVGDFTAGKLGTSQEIQDAVNYFNAATNDDRRDIEETMTEIFQYWHDDSVNPTNDYSIIPISSFMIDGSGNAVMPTAPPIPQNPPITP